MSQQHMETENSRGDQGISPQDDYATALDEALEDNIPGQDDDNAGGPTWGEDARLADTQRHEPIAPPVADQPVQQEVQPQPAPFLPEEQMEEQPKVVEIPAEIREEWERLREISPEAASLAQEDSQEGERIRTRLEEFGAPIALDRAEVVLEQRNRDRKEQRDSAAREQQRIEAHNRMFLEILERDHPEHIALMRDPSRRVEAQARVQDIMNWIETLPYSEGVKLMPIAREGRDPKEVSSLLTRYEQERSGGKRRQRPDPTAAFAIPGRGGNIAPAGVGDKDDFDAALDAGLSSEK